MQKLNVTPQSIYDGTFKFTYDGIACVKCPFDYALYQKLLYEVKPDLLIEIGTNFGGSAMYLADIMNNIGRGVVHTIDIEDKADVKARNHPRIKFFLDGWQNYDLTVTAEFERILVIDDASHYYEDVLGALNKFYPLVSQGSYFIVEDGIIDELGWSGGYRGGPRKAIHEFLQSHEEFCIERSLCDYFGANSTFNTDGYLKRI